MYRDASWLATFGQLLIVFYFLVTALGNLARENIKGLVGRMAELHTPFPAVAFWIGTALQFAGCGLLIIDWHAEIGIYCLILFMVVVSAIFHRFWTFEDPMRHELGRRMLLLNVGVIGGLLLMLENVQRTYS